MAHDELEARLGEHLGQLVAADGGDVALVVLEARERGVALLRDEPLAAVADAHVQQARDLLGERGDQPLLRLDGERLLEEQLPRGQVDAQRAVGAHRPPVEAGGLGQRSYAEGLARGDRHDVHASGPRGVEGGPGARAHRAVVAQQGAVEVGRHQSQSHARAGYGPPSSPGSGGVRGEQAGDPPAPPDGRRARRRPYRIYTFIFNLFPSVPTLLLHPLCSFHFVPLHDASVCFCSSDFILFSFSRLDIDRSYL